MGWLEGLVGPMAKPKTLKLWADQDRHEGDRKRLFTAVSQAITAERVLYPGSFVDIAPSFVWPDVTYVDMDRRARSFFEDVEGVAEIIAKNDPATAGRLPTDGFSTKPVVSFIPGDYSQDLGLVEGSYDLLVSLYAGFISQHCTHYLRVGGMLLVNPSHGDAAMASIDSRYELRAVVESRPGQYRVRRDDLDTYLITKKPVEITIDLLQQSGRGVAYTKSPFAYMFERVA